LELTLIAGRLAKEKRLGLLKALNDRIGIGLQGRIAA
jgi:hypothetical protein